MTGLQEFGLFGGRTKNMEIESRLFMSFRMLLTPEDAQQFRPVFKQNQGARHHGMVRQAQRNHQVQLRLAGNAVMNGETSLPASRFAAHAAAVAVSLQHGLT